MATTPPSDPPERSAGHHGPAVELEAMPISPPPHRPRRRPGRTAGRRRRPARRGRLFLLLALVVLVLAGLGLATLPIYGPQLLSRELGRRLGRPVTVGGLSLDWLEGRITIHHLIAGADPTHPDDTADPFLAADHLAMELDYRQWPPAIQRLELQRPFLHIIRFADHRTNLAPLLVLLPKQLPRGEGGGLLLHDGRLVVEDRVSDTSHQLEDLTLVYPARDLGPETVRLEARLDGTPVVVRSDLRRRDPTGPPTLDFRLNGLDLAAYRPFLPAALSGWLADGRLSAELHLVLDPDDPRLEGECIIENGTLAPPLAGDIGRLAFHLQLWPASRRLTCGRITAFAPRLTLHRHGDHWPLPAAGGNDGWQVTWQGFHSDDGTLSLVDDTVQGGFRLDLTLTDLTVDPRRLNLVATNDRLGRLAVTADQAAAGATWQGTVRLDRLAGRDLALYLPGMPLSVGTLTNLETSFRWEGDKKRLRLAGLGATASDVHLRWDSTIHLHLPKVTVAGGSLDNGGRILEVGRLRAEGKAGTVWFPAHQAAGQPPAHTTGSQPEKGTTGPAQTTQPNQAKTTDNWQTVIHGGYVEELRLVAAPEQNAKPAAVVHDLQVLELGADRRGKISGVLRPAAGGEVRFNGELGLAPLAVAGDVFLADLPVSALPAPLLSWLDGEVRNGILAGRGRLTWPAFSFDGQVSLATLDLRRRQAPLLTLSQAQATDVRITKDRIHCRALTLDRAVLAWHLDGAGHSNLDGLWRRPGKTPPQVRLDEVVVSDSGLDFSNAGVAPTFAARIRRVNGIITGLGNDPAGRAHLRLQGTDADTTLYLVEGKVGFFAPGIAADLTAHVQDMDLARLSPYVEQELGYQLVGGRLAAEIRYHRTKNRLAADADLQLRDIVLGRQLRPLSHLPLALALTADRDGVVHLHLPLRGRPGKNGLGFQATAADVLRNLLLKTAVTPLALLKTLLPDTSDPDLELRTLPFPPGSAALEATAATILDRLALLLEHRPRLALAITGRADGGRDRLALETARRRQALAAQAAASSRQARQVARQYRQEEIAPLPQRPTVPPRPAPVTDEDLLLLARRRAEAVRDGLAARGVPLERLRLRAARLVGADHAGPAGTVVTVTPVPVTNR